MTARRPENWKTPPVYLSGLPVFSHTDEKFEKASYTHGMKREYKLSR